MQKVQRTTGKRSIGRAFLQMAGLTLLMSGALQAQTILGTWQGTLPISKNPRMVLSFSKADDGSLRGSLCRIDMGACTSSILLSAVSFQSPDLSVEQTNIDVGYKGKLSVDGKSITGTWTQDKQPYPMTFVLATPETLWKHDNTIQMSPMAATADPAFEAATIKPSQPDAKERFFGLRTRQFTAKNSTVGDLLRFAYKVRTRQIEGAPSWIDEPRFDIAAVPDTEGVPNEDQDRLMLRKLLADRFHLTLHTVQKVFPVYALTIEKAPPRLSRSDASVSVHGSIYTKEQADGQMLVQFVYNTMPDFADILMNFIPDRQIVDETGLSGPYDFRFTIPTSAGQGNHAPGAEDDRVNAFFQAVQQLGLKLVPKKASLEVLVIDHLEKPSAN
jgi:uncharacterized protein (TIGR03435 family)